MRWTIIDEFSQSALPAAMAHLGQSAACRKKPIPSDSAGPTAICRTDEARDLLDPVRTAGSPLVVGVSGHRNLDPSCIPRLAQQVRDFLEYLKGRLPQTEIRIMTGMAQ